MGMRRSVQRSGGTRRFRAVILGVLEQITSFFGQFSVHLRKGGRHTERSEPRGGQQRVFRGVAEGGRDVTGDVASWAVK